MLKIQLQLAILMTLLNNRRVTRSFLAQKYEISPRSVVRYVDELADAGLPIVSYRGPGGGYAIPDNFRIDRNYFTEEELKRLLACLTATEATFGDSLNQLIIDKISGLARYKSEEQYLLKSDKLIIDIGSWNNPGLHRSKMEVVSRAINEDRTLFINYVDSREEESERFFDPYSLILKDGVWYTYGYCHFRDDFRLFRLTRIRSLTVTEKTFQRMPGDVFAKLKGDFDGKNLVNAVFEFDGSVLSEIEEWLGLEAIKEHNGVYTAYAALFGGKMLIDKLLSLGSSVKVTAPTALKEELLVECARILRRYE